MKNGEAIPYVLGLDIGANSVGWAALKLDGHKKPCGVLKLGARVFDAGVEGDIESGKDVSRGQKRQEAKQGCRQFERKGRRSEKIFNALQQAGLLPPSKLPAPPRKPAAAKHAWRKEKAQERHDILTQLHCEQLGRWTNRLQTEGASPKEVMNLPQALPYVFRARALDERLELYDLGRAFYHLGQRRGFLSNAKTSTPIGEVDEAKLARLAARTRKKMKGQPEDKIEEEIERQRQKMIDEETGKVKEGIAELTKEIQAADARTLGEYFAGLRGRIRGRWTSRQMFLDEFEAIWVAQAPKNPLLTEPFKKKLKRAIFFQRPLKSQAMRVGWCELEREPKRRRAPFAILPAQRLRYLQKVNDILVVSHKNRNGRPLSDKERAAIIERLDTEGDLRFEDAYKLLGLEKGHRFNHDAGADDKLPGNRSAKRMIAAFGKARWCAFRKEEQDAAVEDWWALNNDEALHRCATEKWGLDEKGAPQFVKAGLEGTYCRLSRQALSKIVPQLEKGIPYAEARNAIYGPRKVEQVDELPAVRVAMPILANPTVARALTELRKVVNALVKVYGKPDKVRIEFARDLKKSRRNRKEITAQNSGNRRARENAAARILADKDSGVTELKPRDPRILRVLLADECNWHCPYTGKCISMAALVGANPQFDIEHIIPFDRCLDDSYFNKTLCYHEENRNIKKKQTPWEAYGHDSKKWDEIMQHVRAFKPMTKCALVKLPGGKELIKQKPTWPKTERFLLQDTESLDKFTHRQLNDTRYAARLAADYVGLLFGWTTESTGSRKVQVSKGGITGYLRDEYDLNKILGERRDLKGDERPSGEKSRDDHRHHAIDAVLTALADSDTVAMLSDAARRAMTERRKRFGRIPPPWGGFFDEVASGVTATLVSHRVSRKISGALHEESFYSGEKRDEKGRPVRHIRKLLHKLSAREMRDIVDPVVRQKVLEKFAELCAASQKSGVRKKLEPKDVFGQPDLHPVITTRTGAEIPIHKVRVRKSITVFQIGTDPQPRERFVKTDSNHHAEIWEETDKKGKKVWKGEVITLAEAVRRLKAREEIVNRHKEDGKRFLFSLAFGEIVELDEGEGSRRLYRIRTAWPVENNVRVAYVRINDARKEADIKASKQFFTARLSTLQELRCEKKTIDPLGEVRRAND